jgi:hypothetical protein
MAGRNLLRFVLMRLGGAGWIRKRIAMRLIFFPTLILAGPVAVACGSGGPARLGHDEYLQRMREIEAGADARSADRLFFELVTEPRLSEKSCLARVREFDGNLHNIVDEVASLRPPRPIQSLQDRFVSAARESVTEIDDTVKDVQAGTLTCGMRMNRQIYGLPSTLRAQQVLEEFGKRGYRIGSNSD